MCGSGGDRDRGGEREGLPARCALVVNVPVASCMPSAAHSVPVWVPVFSEPL